MLAINEILLPIDFPVSSLAVIHQAAVLVQRFNSKIILLHVATERSHAAGVPESEAEMARWDLVAAVLAQAEKEQDFSLRPALENVSIRSRMVKGATAAAIVRAAQEEKVDLIMMPSHSFTFYQFLLGSVTAQVLHGTECPVWTGAHLQVAPVAEFAISKILCAVEFGARAANTVSWASGIATKFGAELALANVTAGVELWGAGGNYVDQRWKEELVANAMHQMAKLQKETGLENAKVIIGNGDASKFLSEVTRQEKADLLVSGCYPYGDRLRTHGYGIISAVSIPVLSI